MHWIQIASICTLVYSFHPYPLIKKELAHFRIQRSPPQPSHFLGWFAGIYISNPIILIPISNPIRGAVVQEIKMPVNWMCWNLKANSYSFAEASLCGPKLLSSCNLCSAFWMWLERGFPMYQYRAFHVTFQMCYRLLHHLVLSQCN